MIEPGMKDFAKDYLVFAAKTFARTKARALFERPEIKNAAQKLRVDVADLFELELAITDWLAECSVEFFRLCGSDIEKRMLRLSYLLSEALNTQISAPLIVKKGADPQK